MKRISLNGKWTLEGLSPEGKKTKLCGNVPGCALDALVKANTENDDIFMRDNANAYQKYERYSWIYKKSFDVSELPENAKLVFSRLDTYCDVFLNGKHLGHRENGNIPHSFDASSALICGENTVEIYFTSPISAVEGKRELLGAFTTERLHTRRMQCTYGWDWTMRFVTSGIGNAFVEIPDNTLSVKSAYVYTLSVDCGCAEIGIDIETENYARGGILTAEIYDDCKEKVYSKELYCEESFVRLNVDIEEPKLWYPTEYGQQPLYSLVMKSGENEVYRTVFGIRTVKILELEDKPGSPSYNLCLELKKTSFSQQYDFNDKFSSFILMVNGKKIMCKGANWVPCEPFVTEGMEEKITTILQLAKDAGVNMLRVWGGGAFECEHFYDECSRLGILVTQDFLMACGKYPEDEAWFLEQLGQEAEYACGFLRNKACLMWWTGDNENAVNGCDTDTNYMGRSSAYKAIAPVLYKNDPHRRFLPSSPYGGKNYASNTAGTTHNTQYLSHFFEYLEESDFTDYKEYLKLYNARFIAEDPCFGAIDEESLKKFMTHEDIYGDDFTMWKYHTQSNPALSRELFDYYYILAEKLLGKFENPEDRFFKLKYIQYEWIRVALERARRNKFFCSGTIFWMLSDCWPAAAGWAIIDYYNKPKAAYYSFRRSAKALISAIDLENDKYTVFVCNDGKEESVTLRWHAIRKSDGTVVYTSPETPYSAKENETAPILEIESNQLPDGCFMVAEISDRFGIVDRSFYIKGNLPLHRCDDRFEIVSKTKESVTVKANAYIHILEISGDITPDDNYFHMMPGETRTVKFKGSSNVRCIAYTL